MRGTIQLADTLRALPRSGITRLSLRPVPAPKTASRGLRPLSHHRLSRWRPQATDASGKMHSSYDPVRRGSVLPQSGNDDPPPCDALQRGLQKLGRYGVKLGGDVTTAGLVITGGGLAVAGVSASTVVLAPGGVLLGGSIATGGANVTLGGGVITTVGALSMLFGGSGKETVADLAGRVVSSKIPAGLGRDVVGNAVQGAVKEVAR